MNLCSLRVPRSRFYFSCVSKDSSSLNIRISNKQIEADVGEIRILFASGGTGGHVYPGIAIADAVAEIHSNVAIHFAGTKERMEWRAVPASGYNISAVDATSIRRPIFSPLNLLLPVKLACSLWRCLALIATLKPDVIVGTGGYVSWPTCFAGWMSGCPLVIAEQNAHAGLANRVLGFLAESVFVAFSEAEKFFPGEKCILKGNPVRSALSVQHKKTKALAHFWEGNYDLSPSFPSVIAVLGGSLGAHCINNVMIAAAEKLLEDDENRVVIWQTGKQYFDRVIQAANPHPRLIILPYVDRMDLLYSAADLIVGRSGAITCSELLVTGTPSLLIPSKNVTEDHQTKNARSMVEIGASRMLPEDDLTESSLRTALEDLLADRSGLEEMGQRAKQAALPNAAAEIASEVLSLAKQRKRTKAGRALLLSFLLSFLSMAVVAAKACISLARSHLL